jgi:uncharacterized membrane protein
MFPKEDCIMPNDIAVNDGAGRTTAGINLLLGIWVFVSPWIYGAAGRPNAWNSWIVGGFIALFAIIRLGSPTGARGLAWVNMILGAWMFVSPWVYGYTANSARFANSLCVGALIFILAIVGGSSHAVRTTGFPSQPRA